MIEREDNCLACRLNQEADEELGGVVWETDYWRVEHGIGKSGEGSMVVKLKRHIEWMDELTENELFEFGPLVASITRAIREVTGADRCYVNMWAEESRHVHFVLMPVTQELRDSYGGLKASKLQAAMAQEQRPIDKQKTKELTHQIRQKLFEIEGAVG